jgi:hypothetical protein
MVKVRLTHLQQQQDLEFLPRINSVSTGEDVSKVITATLWKSSFR